MSDLRDRLRSSLVAAMKARDQVAVAALRTAIAALENAEAVPAAPIEGRSSGVFGGAVVGLGAGEVPRRELSDAESVAIVQAEIDERAADAANYEAAGKLETADRLRAEAEILRPFVE